MSPKSSEKIKKLKYVEVDDENIDLSKFPDFMIIGPHRTGTTWLWENLSRHPQVFLTTPKEPQFFYFLDRPQAKNFSSNKLQWYMDLFNESVSQYLRKNLLSLRRYGELYRPKVRGEASTNYAIIDEYLLNELIILNPDIKAIILIRNPVDRAWSNAKLNYFNDNKNLSEISESELFGFFHGSRQIKCGRYSNIINKWSKYLKDGNLFVGFFDDIVDDPEELLLRIYDFLGVRSEKKYIPHTVRNRINELQSVDLPEKHQIYLKNLFQGELDFLRDKYGLSWYD